MTQKAGITLEMGEKVKVCKQAHLPHLMAVEEIDEEKSRLKVSVSIFGRATPVNLS